MLLLPSALEPVFMNLSVAFTEPTAARMAVLMVGMILARGRRTITAALRVMGWLADGHFSAYHRLFSRSPWSVWTLGQVLARLIIELFPAGERIPIEVTFEEVRAHLGFETTRQRVEKSVLRMAPCLLGLFSVISLAFAKHARRHRVRPMCTDWYAKTDITFSDALATMRRLLWEQTVFGTSPYTKQYAKLQPALRNALLDYLCPAA